MMSAKSKTKEEKTSYEVLQKELSEAGIGDLFGLADSLATSHVEFVSTGFKALDKLLQDKKMGLARGKDVEIYSKDGSAGKTSLALKIVKSWQSQGYKTAFVDIEGTVDQEYLDQQGILCKPEDCPEGIYPMLMTGHKRDVDGKPVRLSMEVILDGLKKASNIFDLVVVDSVAALMPDLEADKQTAENAKIGNVAKPLGDFLKKNVAKNATIIWINQTRQGIGGNMIYYVTTGGRALKFYTSVRLSLDKGEKAYLGDQEKPWASITTIRCVKNKLGPDKRACNLAYIIDDRQFSEIYDYYKAAIAEA
jgi:recombination protein RecA